MRRRDFIMLLGGAAAGWPLLAARAQQAGKLPIIGFLGTDAPAWGPWTAAFVQRLRELSWIEGRTVGIEYRWSEARHEREIEIAAEFVHLKVDVIVTAGRAATTVKEATADIPIVFALTNDPIGSGLVANLGHPGGNVTGLSTQSPDLAGKRFELLREVVPSLRRLAVMANVSFPDAALEMNEVEAAARALGLEVLRLEISRAEDIAPTSMAMKAHADAFYVVGDPLVNANRTHIIALALSARLPTVLSNRAYVQVGGLMSYGPNYADQFRRAAEYVDKILRGAKPADLPVEQPTRFELVINLKTAKTIGLTVPPTLLARADEVIE